MSALRMWWQAREARERRVLAIGAVVAVVMLLWALVWKPLQDQRIALAEGNQRLAADLALMRAAAGELGERQLGEDADRSRAGRSLLALADAGIREIGLAGSLRRIEPSGDGRVRLRLESVPFDPIAEWLERRARAPGVGTAELTATRTQNPGRVGQQMLIEDP